MKLWGHLIALVLALLSTAASANVVFAWETVSTSPTIHSASGLLEVTDEAWQSGGLQTTYYGGYPPEPSAFVRLDFFVHGNYVGGAGDVSQYSDWSLNLDFSESDLLTGVIYFNCAYCDMTISMSGQQELWTIHHVSGPSNHCAFYPENRCKGATGYWRKVENGQVPEPPGLLLLAVGMAALSLFARDTGRKQ